MCLAAGKIDVVNGLKSKHFTDHFFRKHKDILAKIPSSGQTKNSLSLFFLHIQYYDRGWTGVARYQWFSHGIDLVPSDCSSLKNCKSDSVLNEFNAYILMISSALKQQAHIKCNCTSSGNTPGMQATWSSKSQNISSRLHCNPHMIVAIMVGFWAPSQYKDRLIHVWRFPC